MREGYIKIGKNLTIAQKVKWAHKLESRMYHISEIVPITQITAFKCLMMGELSSVIASGKRLAVTKLRALANPWS